MTSSPWLVVIDMQLAFAAPSSQWAAEGYPEIVPTVEKLADAHRGRVVYTRFVRDPAEHGQWSAYYDRWPSFRVTPEDPVWELTLTVPAEVPVIDEPTFSKWAPQLQRVVGDAPLRICGVATECCVLGTALAAADDGREVVVIADACAGASHELHNQALTIMDTMAPLLSVTTSDRL
ncbi:MAG: cysteine hydrolase [Microbacteriaceae bacterium]|nr:MAG: cysteine hydrolase [Microbacteriaceae bacterium]